jgi:hypothetical protein
VASQVGCSHNVERVTPAPGVRQRAPILADVEIEDIAARVVAMMIECDVGNRDAHIAKAWYEAFAAKL